MRLRFLSLVVVVSVVAALGAQSTSRSAGWTTYAGDARGSRYSPLTQINTKNVAQLKLAWQYGVAQPNASTGSKTPIRSCWIDSTSRSSFDCSVPERVRA